MKKEDLKLIQQCKIEEGLKDLVCELNDIQVHDIPNSTQYNSKGQK